jgi:hypothetical protein
MQSCSSMHHQPSTHLIDGPTLGLASRAGRNGLELRPIHFASLDFITWLNTFAFSAFIQSIVGRQQQLLCKGIDGIHRVRVLVLPVCGGGSSWFPLFLE